MHTKNYILHAKKIVSENVCLRTKFDLQLKKTKKFWGKFSKLLEKGFVSPSKNVSHTISIYAFLSPVCSTVLKMPQKRLNFFLLFFENV